MMRYLILCISLILSSATITAQSITRIATNLQNPRGIAILPDGRLLVAEAGSGFSSDDPTQNTGKLSIFEDKNGDGDYDDSDEITRIFQYLPGYNLLTQANPGRDEVVGIGDVLVLEDGRAFFTLDDNFLTIAIVELSPTFERQGNLLERGGSLNAIVYDENRELIYVAESSFNSISSVSLDGTAKTLAQFENLASGQQAVPAGLAIDPLTDDILVALFSGQLFDYYGAQLSFMPFDAKIVRVNPDSSEITDEITGLTTAVDLATDETGNIYVVEMTTRWAPAPLDFRFPLFDADAPPDDGGYARFTGRVSLYPADKSEPIILADGLDTPTNITYYAGNLYVSVGQGTPGRPIIGANGKTQIVGEIYKIQL